MSNSVFVITVSFDANVPGLARPVGDKPHTLEMRDIPTLMVCRFYYRDELREIISGKQRVQHVTYGWLL